MKMEPLGNGNILYAGCYVITIDQAKQLLIDEDKRLTERSKHFAYNGE